MAMDNPQVRQWLQQAAGRYRQAERVYNDAVMTLAAYPNLLPKLDQFTHVDGKVSHILCLYGTIPVSYKGSTYNIPIELWLPEMYPVVAPYAFVKPTATMLINPSKDVDANGKVFHAYLHYWDYRSSNLVNAVGVLQQAFAVDPPVYARPHNQPPPTTVYPPPQFVPTPASTGSTATGMPPQPSGSSQLSSPTSLLNSRIPNTLPPPMDPHAIKLNALRADVADKLTAKFTEFSSAMTSEMEALLHENKVLYEAQTRVQQKADALDQEVVQLGTNLAFVEKRVGEYQSMVEAWESKPALAPEDILVAANPIQAQMLDAVAEDHAIEDTMYMLGKALDDGKIDGAVFLKTIRSLAKEQFLQRALVQKCAKALSG